MPGTPPAQLTFHLIPHTHWDREWYLTRAELQARLVPVLDEVLSQLEEDRSARFLLDGQTVLPEDYLAVRPDQKDRMASLAARGVLEAGPWYVLSDLLIPAAASLRTNLELGAEDAGRLGRRLDVLYSPDAFGHPAELPALAAEYGIRWAVVRRGLGRPGGKDRDLYRWEAPGGKHLLVYHLPSGGYDAAIELANQGVDPVAAWAAVRSELVPRAVTAHVAVFLGADHHAMARNVSAIAARVQALEPEHRVRVSGLAEFFEAVETARARLPVIRGELRRCDGHAWVLQGVHSARARMKRRHSGIELTLSRVAQPLAALAADRAGPDQGGLLRLAWRTLLQSQFHDTLAGTTSDAVQAEQEVRLAAVAALAREMTIRAVSSLESHDPDRARDNPAEDPPRLAIWNPSARPRTGILTAELAFFRRDVLVGPPAGRTTRTGAGHRPFVLEYRGGEEIPVQVLSVRPGQHRTDAMRHYPDQDEVDRVWIACQGLVLPPLGTGALLPRPGNRRPPERGLQTGSGFLGNEYVTLRVSRGGAIALEDHRTGERHSELCDLIDEADRGDLYTFSRGEGAAVRGGRPGFQKVIAAGPLIGAIETRWTMRSAGAGELGVRQLVVLHADSPIIRIRLDVENQAMDHRLRARFPVPGGDSVLAGTALGSIRRSLAVSEEAGGDSLERQPASAPAHRYLAAGSGRAALAVLAPGFFEYGWDESGGVSVTLLRAVGELSRGVLPERPGHAAWPLSAPDAQEPGPHVIHLALAPLLPAESEDATHLERLWEDAWLPVQSWWLGKPVGGDGEW